MHSKRDERMIEWMMEFCLFKKMPSVVAGAFCAAIPFVFCALTLRAPARRSFGRICVGRNAGEERAAHDAHVARVDGALGSLRSEFGRTFATASRTFVFFFLTVGAQRRAFLRRSSALLCRCSCKFATTARTSTPACCTTSRYRCRVFARRSQRACFCVFDRFSRPGRDASSSWPRRAGRQRRCGARVARRALSGRREGRAQRL